MSQRKSMKVDQNEGLSKEWKLIPLQATAECCNKNAFHSEISQ
jgi:hypothetical protein